MGESAGKIQVAGSVQVLDRSATHIRTKLSGFFDETVSREFISIMDTWRGGRTGVTAFHDISGIEDYDVAARELIARWAKAQVGAISAAHMLVERRTIAWALDIIGMVSGFKITTYRSAAAYEAAYKHFMGVG